MWATSRSECISSRAELVVSGVSVGLKVQFSGDLSGGEGVRECVSVSRSVLGA